MSWFFHLLLQFTIRMVTTLISLYLRYLPNIVGTIHGTSIWLHQEKIARQNYFSHPFERILVILVITIVRSFSSCVWRVIVLTFLIGRISGTKIDCSLILKRRGCCTCQTILRSVSLFMKPPLTRFTRWLWIFFYVGHRVVQCVTENTCEAECPEIFLFFFSLGHNVISFLNRT